MTSATRHHLGRPVAQDPLHASALASVAAKTFSHVPYVYYPPLQWQQLAWRQIPAVAPLLPCLHNKPVDNSVMDDETAAGLLFALSAPTAKRAPCAPQPHRPPPLQTCVPHGSESDTSEGCRSDGNDTILGADAALSPQELPASPSPPRSNVVARGCHPVASAIKKRRPPASRKVPPMVSVPSTPIGVAPTAAPPPVLMAQGGFLADMLADVLADSPVMVRAPAPVVVTVVVPDRRPSRLGARR